MRTLWTGTGEGLHFLLSAFQILVVVQCVFGWVGADPDNPIVRAVDALVGPTLAWLRRRLPFLVIGVWDLSPVAAYLICLFLDSVLAGRLRLLAAGI